MMTPEEAKQIMDSVVEQIRQMKLPKGFEPSISVPMNIATLTKAYYVHPDFPVYPGGFAAGEPFYYKGIRCFATPEK